MALAFAAVSVARADDPPKNEEDLKREAAIAEFTRKMKEANYPALFEKAAQEFNVPADVLKGVAFAETRWEHLRWPPGETVSPENGMPRPYGIMSLWDNEFFGHTLIEAAKLIGKDPEELKKDPLQNMRGAAALLKKLYEENPKPSGTTDQDIESWRYAVVKYCGIPEPDLSNRHALDVYEFMNKGYHQYGIEWEARPVNLAPMRAEVKAIVDMERAKAEARMKAEELAQAAATNQSPPTPAEAPELPPKITQRDAEKKLTSTAPAPAAVAVTAPPPTTGADAWLKPAFILPLAAVLVLVSGYLVFRRQPNS